MYEYALRPPDEPTPLRPVVAIPPEHFSSIYAAPFLANSYVDHL